MNGDNKLVPAHPQLPTAAAQPDMSNITYGTLSNPVDITKPSAYKTTGGESWRPPSTKAQLQAAHGEKIITPDGIEIRIRADEPEYRPGTPERRALMKKLNEAYPKDFPLPEPEPRRNIRGDLYTPEPTGDYGDLLKGMGGTFLRNNPVSAAVGTIGGGGLVQGQPPTGKEKSPLEALKAGGLGGAVGNILDETGREVVNAVAPGATKMERGGSAVANLLTGILSGGFQKARGTAAEAAGKRSTALSKAPTPAQARAWSGLLRGGKSVMAAQLVRRAGFPKIAVAIEAGWVTGESLYQAAKSPSTWNFLEKFFGDKFTKEPPPPPGPPRTPGWEQAGVKPGAPPSGTTVEHPPEPSGPRPKPPVEESQMEMDRRRGIVTGGSTPPTGGGPPSGSPNPPPAGPPPEPPAPGLQGPPSGTVGPGPVGGGSTVPTAKPGQGPGEVMSPEAMAGHDAAKAQATKEWLEKNPGGDPLKEGLSPILQRAAEIQQSGAGVSSTGNVKVKTPGAPTAGPTEFAGVPPENKPPFVSQEMWDVVQKIKEKMGSAKPLTPDEKMAYDFYVKQLIEHGVKPFETSQAGEAKQPTLKELETLNTKGMTPQELLEHANKIAREKGSSKPVGGGKLEHGPAETGDQYMKRMVQIQRITDEVQSKIGEGKGQAAVEKLKQAYDKGNLTIDEFRAKATDAIKTHEATMKRVEKMGDSVEKALGSPAGGAVKKLLIDKFKADPKMSLKQFETLVKKVIANKGKPGPGAANINDPSFSEPLSEHELKLFEKLDKMVSEVGGMRKMSPTMQETWRRLFKRQFGDPQEITDEDMDIIMGRLPSK